MEGLEVVEVKLSATLENRDFRVDSAFYTKAPKKNKNLEYRKIGDCLASSQYGISIEMNENDKGYPIYRMNEMHNMLCDLDVDKCADISKSDYERFALKDKDVLFNRTNSFEWVGRTGIYYVNDDIKRTFASYLVRFNPDEKILLPEYLCAFLNSKQGVWDVKRRARQSINQTNVNPEEVKEIEIPILEIDFQKKIQFNFREANRLRIQSKTLYSEAEEMLLEELGLKDWQPTNESVSVKSFSDFQASGRLDAEYYQPKYDEIENQLINFGVQNLDKYCNVQDKNFTPLFNKEYRYIELANIGANGDITGCTETIGEELPSRARRLVHKGDLIVSSIEGSLQSCAIITDEYNNALCSTGFYVLSPTTINVETLLLVFKSHVMQALMKKGCSGTILTALSKDELMKLQLPNISQPVQQQIATKIQQSFVLKAESKRLLEKAKVMVEREIEKGNV